MFRRQKSPLWGWAKCCTWNDCTPSGGVNLTSDSSSAPWPFSKTSSVGETTLSWNRRQKMLISSQVSGDFWRRKLHLPSLHLYHVCHDSKFARVIRCKCPLLMHLKCTVFYLQPSSSPYFTPFFTKVSSGNLRVLRIWRDTRKWHQAMIS